jgi:hypothetical protein
MKSLDEIMEKTEKEYEKLLKWWEWIKQEKKG